MQQPTKLQLMWSLVGCFLVYWSRDNRVSEKYNSIYLL